MTSSPNGDPRIDTLPLLRLLKGNAATEMFSRHWLNRSGIRDDVVAEAERRGEVVVGEGGTFASVLLTVDGDAALRQAGAGGDG